VEMNRPELAPVVDFLPEITRLVGFFAAKRTEQYDRQDVGGIIGINGG
jgi:hypothetical protein